MTDLFANQPTTKVGTGNALFLADLAIGTTDDAMRAKFKQGAYPDLHKASVAGWRHLMGRK